jgi:two-component system phosphate regulon sensor histidine kinase PhoR
MPLQERVSAETLKKLIKKELEESGVKTKFEFEYLIMV